MTPEHRQVVIPYPDIPPGNCRWCGERIDLGRRRARRWHDGRSAERDCLREYLIAQNQRTAWTALIDRDGILCACGCATPIAEAWKANGTTYHSPINGAEVDHRVPLIDGGEKTIENLQILAGACHRKKTALEARERALRRRRRVRGSQLARPEA